MVRCQDLTKRFGDFTATSNMFDVQQGEILGLLGPNGAGKSTTFKMLCGLIRPNRRCRRSGGLDLRRSRQAKIQLGYMAQKFSSTGRSPCARTWISSPVSMASGAPGAGAGAGDDRNIRTGSAARQVAR